MAAALRTQALLIFSAIGVGFAAVAIWNFYWPVDRMFDVTGYPLGRDFANVWSAPQIAAHSGAAALFDFNFYQEQLARLFRPTIAPLMWSYPPSMLLLVWPFGRMPYWVAFAVWTLAGLCLYGATVLARLPREHRRCAAAFLALAPATVVNIVVGQNGFFTAALMLGGIVCIDKRPWLSGILFGLLSVKPQLGLLIPVVLVAVAAWSAIAAALLTAAAVAAASVALWGIVPWQEWITRIGPATYQLVAEFRGFHGYMMPSVFASLRDVGVPPEFADIGQTIVSVAVVAVTPLLFRRTTDVALRALLLTSGTLLVTPYAFNYDLTALTGAVLWLMMAPQPIYGRDLAFFGAVWVLPMAIYVLNGLHTGLAAWLIGAVYGVAVIRIRQDQQSLDRLGSDLSAIDRAAAG